MTATAVAERLAPRALPRGRRRWLTWLGPRPLVLGVAFLFVFGVALRPMTDPDFWWHLETGRWIVTNHMLPARDLYTFTVPGHPWMDHEWLSEVLMWLGYQVGGMALLSIAFAIVTWLGVLFLFLAADGRRRPQVVVGLGLGLAMVAGFPIWSPRTQEVTFALSCLVVLWVQRFVAGRSKALRFLPLVIALWANLHSGFVIAFVILGVAASSEAVHWIVGIRRHRDEALEHRSRLVELAAIGLLSAVAVLATPNGFKLWLYPFLTQSSAAQQSLIVEWFSPNFQAANTKPLELLILALVAGFAIRRPSLYQLLLCLTTLAMTLQSARHMAFFIAAAAPVLIESASAGWQRAFGPLAGLGGRARSPLWAGLNAAVIGAVAALVLVHGTQVLAGQPRLTKATYPVAAADWLQAHPEAGHRIFNEYTYGGYLAYRFPGERRVFIFGEAEVMGDPLIYQYVDAGTARPGWQTILDRYGVDTVMVERGSPLGDLLATQTGWRLVYSDSQAVIYIRPAAS